MRYYRELLPETIRKPRHDTGTIYAGCRQKLSIGCIVRSTSREDKTEDITNERISALRVYDYYATLLTESKAIEEQLERERLEQQRAARQREMERERLALEHELQQIHEHQDTYWHYVDKSVDRNFGAGYDSAVQMLIKIRDSASRFKETPAFQTRFHAWIQPHLRRAALVKRLQQHKFILPV